MGVTPMTVLQKAGSALLSLACSGEARCPVGRPVEPERLHKDRQEALATNSQGAKVRSQPATALGMTLEVNCPLSDETAAPPGT